MPPGGSLSLGSSFGAGLLLLLLGFLSLGPPSAGELRHEEGRRALPAREMLGGGSPVLPTLWGQPYLSKPPLYFWTVAGAAVVLEGGEVTPAAVRWPALLSALLLGLLLYSVARPWVGTWPAFWGALALLAAPELAAKARLGEIETLFAFLCALGSFAALGALSALRREPARPAGAGQSPGGRGEFVGFALCSGLATGLAFLAKGPLALLFGLGPLLSAALLAAERRRALRALLLSLPLAVLPAALWYGALLHALPEDGGALATFQRELGRGGGGGAITYLADRLRFVPGFLLGALPISAALLWALARGPARAELLASRSARLALLGLLPGLLVLFLWPAVRARYALPLVPMLVFAALPILAANAGSQLARVARGVWTLCAALWVVLVPAAAVALWHWIAPIGPLAEHLGEFTTGAVPMLLLVAALAQLPLARRAGAGPRSQAAALLGFLAVGALVGAAEGTRNFDRHGRAAGAAEIQRLLAGRALHTDHWGHFNLLFGVDPAPRWCADPGALAADAALLRSTRQGAPGAGWVPLSEGGWDPAALEVCPELGSLAVWVREP